jgi:hypothetical protein
MFCSNCGKNLSSDALFCAGCGLKVPSPVASVVENPSPVASVVENPSPVASVVENPSPVASVVENPSPVASVVENPSPIAYAVEDTSPIACAIENPSPTVSTVDNSNKFRDESSSDQYSNGNTKQKRKKKIAIVGLFAIIGIAIIFSICYAFFTPSIKAAFLGPKNYYFTLEKNNLSELSQDIRNSYTKKSPKKYNYEYDISTKISGDILEESDYAKSFIEELSKIHFNLKLDGNDENLQDSYFTASLDGLLDGKKIGSFVAESADNKTKISFPDLTDKTIGYEVEAKSVKLKNAMLGDDKAFEEVFGIKNEAFKKMMVKYVKDVIFECIPEDQVKFQSTAKYQDFKCNSITISLNENIMSDIYKSLAKEMKKDEDFKKFFKASTLFYFDLSSAAKLNNTEKLSSEEINDAFDTLCNGLEDAANNIEKTDIEYSIYFNNKGTIVGRKFVNKDTDTLVDIGAYKNSDKKDIVKCDIEQNGDKTFQFLTESKVDKGNYIGTISFKSNENTLLDAEYTSEIDATVGGLNAFVGNIKGKLNLEPLNEGSFDSMYSTLKNVNFSYDSKRSENDKLSGEFKISTAVDEKSLILSIFTETKQSNSNLIKKPLVSISDSISITDAGSLGELQYDIGVSLGRKLVELFPNLYNNQF